MRYPSVWVAIARQEHQLGALAAAANWTTPTERPGVGAWTDDFSNVFSVLMLRAKPS